MSKHVTGDRFIVNYLLKGQENDARNIAKDICIEQSVEFPEELINDDFIKQNVIGRIENFIKINSNLSRASISFAVETSALELTQFINVIFGNISLKPGIFIEDFILPEIFYKNFKGPAFGIDGIRDILKIHDKPIIASALKPMGLTTTELAELAYKFAKGGINIIKDDHGLSDQSFSTFKDRIKSCSAAIKNADSETGNKTLYFPNITAPFNEIEDRALFAKEAGAGGLLISPAITGFDAMRYISENKNLNLPVMSHPAFAGTFISGSSGFSHRAFFGLFNRLAGADMVVYPNFGGRFSFSEDECRSIITGLSEKFCNFKSILPVPGGGMTFSNIPQMASFYGNNVVYLMGGGLFKRCPDLIKNCQELISLVT